MASQTDMNSYQRGVELAEIGHYEAALACMREHLHGAPDDVQALNDAGAILHCLGRSVDAIDYLKRAHRLRGESGEVVWNLVEAYLAAGMASEAALLFEAMEHSGILNIEVLNRTRISIFFGKCETRSRTTRRIAWIIRQKPRGKSPNALRVNYIVAGF